jgi:hypothetical protein
MNISCSNVIRGTVPWLRCSVAGLSPRGPGFAPESVHMGFVVDKVALGRVFLRVLRLSPVHIIPLWLSMLIYHLVMVAAVRRHRHSP